MVFCLLVFSVSEGFSIEKKIEIGGKTGWDAIAVEEGLTKSPGRFGAEALVLDSAVLPGSENAELLISFEDNSVSDETGNYNVVSSGVGVVSGGVVGKKAGQTAGAGSGIVLSGTTGTMFGTEGWTGSFTIEFWLCPSVIDDGEVILSWNSSRNVAGYSVYQIINAGFSGNKVQWSFVNVFAGYTDNQGEVTLEGTKTLIPGEWSRHVLSFDESNGLLEYRVNDLIEDIRYLTVSAKERGTVYPVNLGYPSDLELCPSYSGKIDSFRILPKSNAESWDSFFYTIDKGQIPLKYNVEGGFFETEPLLVQEGSVLLSINADIAVPGETAVQFFVRGGDNYYNISETDSPWVPVELGAPITGIKGHFFQIAAKLFPDGAGLKSPTVTSITVTYYEQEPPTAPYYIRITPGDGFIDISWSHSIDNVTGYYVYYGERPGEYLGRIAIEGASPVYVKADNSVRLSGLTNGKIYYFAIASEYNGVIGPLSEEFFARPLLKYY